MNYPESEQRKNVAGGYLLCGILIILCNPKGSGGIFAYIPKVCLH